MSRYCLIAVRAYHGANNEVGAIVRSCMERLACWKVKPELVYHQMKRAGVSNVDLFVKYIRLGDFAFCTYQQVYTYRYFVGLLCDMEAEAAIPLENGSLYSVEDIEAFQKI